MNDVAALQEIKRVRYAEDASPQDVDRLYELLFDKNSSRTAKAAVIQTLRHLQSKWEGALILMGDRFVLLDIDVPEEKTFSLFVLDIFGVQGKGTCVSGFVSDGRIKVGQSLVLEKADSRDIETVCTEVTGPGSTHMKPGSVVHVFLSDLTMGEVSQGDRLRHA